MIQETAAAADSIPLERRQIVRELNLDRVRDLLDWLEANGVDTFDVEMDQSAAFQVAWTERLYAVPARPRR